MQDNHGQCTSNIFHYWIRDLFGKSWPKTYPPSYYTGSCK